ncbi:MAG TPA: LytS/YhcK type 5TM receptor domain-containing protein, partial [Negativicutes bacterium]|nr:LytS/YhcK type 5TM receptor domain-containing protein [Negativicutes bacterium]
CSAMRWNNTMLFPEWALTLQIMQNVALIGIFAYLLTRLPAFRRTITYSQYRIYDKLLLGLVFGFISAAGNWVGIPIHGAIANCRIVGAIAGGLVGGPVVGFIAGTIGALARYYMGGFTVSASVLSNIIAGVIGGLIYERYGPQRVNVKIAFLTGLLGEAVLKVLILLMSKPFEAALKLEQAIAVPTMLGNSLAVAFFIYIIRDVLTEQQRMQAFSVQQAIRMIRKTNDIFKEGLNKQSASQVASIIHSELRPAATAVTDTADVLSFIGVGEDHHRPGTPIITEATRRAMSSKQTVIVSKREEIGCPNPDCKLSAVISAPIVTLGEIVGTIKVYKTGHDVITPDEAQMIQGIADSLGLQLAQQRFEVQQLVLLQTEYSMLKAQINPHFFFNTLSTIQALVRKDSGAVNLIKDLAEFFRKTLKRGDEMVPIREEIEAVNIYFRIEKARFRERVNLDINIPDEMQDYLIPVFSLQPLVENAIRHGISMKRGGGVVSLTAGYHGEKAYIKVADNGVGMSEERLAQVAALSSNLSSPKGAGIGLENVNRRMRKLFGEEYGLSITSGKGAGTEVTILMPWGRGGADKC